MTTASVDLSHDGKTWILKVIPAKTSEVVDVAITDSQKKELENAGVEIYGVDGRG